jgi:hypothetical protein
MSNTKEDTMTLDEAIEHARDVGTKLLCKCETRECGKEHIQLAKWLEELKGYREGRKPGSMDSIVNGI